MKAVCKTFSSLIYFPPLCTFQAVLWTVVVSGLILVSSSSVLDLYKIDLYKIVSIAFIATAKSSRSSNIIVVGFFYFTVFCGETKKQTTNQCWTYTYSSLSYRATALSAWNAVETYRRERPQRSPHARGNAFIAECLKRITPP